MTIRASNSPTCRQIKHLLGVYIVGAIDPAERSVVDEHLEHCQTCRDELAGLAGLPAMLSRVPAADVERLSLAPDEPPDFADLPDELLNSLLRKVSARRRSRLWRGGVTVAAAAVIAAGGAAAAVQLAAPSASQAAHTDVASAVSSRTGVAAVVDYTKTSWGGIAMRVQVSGIPSGTTCQFWVMGQDGRAFAGQWTVMASYGSKAWYVAASSASPSTVQTFQITAHGKTLLSIPAT
jgi:anti-sigma-K factor RskA